MPLVSIGLPIYNESRFLKSTLECLKRQSYKNIELILSDNASTDSSAKLLSDFVRKTKNASLKIHPKSIVADDHYRYVLSKAKGKYFMFGSGHDLWDIDFIEKLVDVLENRQDILLAVPSVRKIDTSGGQSEIKQHIDTRRFESELARATHLYSRMVGCNPFMGLFDRETLITNYKVEPKIVNDDFLILMRTAKSGHVVTENRVCYYRRDNRPGETVSQKKRRVKTYYELTSYRRLLPNISSRAICFKEFLFYNGTWVELLSLTTQLTWRFFLHPSQIIILSKELLNSLFILYKYK